MKLREKIHWALVFSHLPRTKQSSYLMISIKENVLLPAQNHPTEHGTTVVFPG